MAMGRGVQARGSQRVPDNVASIAVCAARAGVSHTSAQRLIEAAPAPGQVTIQRRRRDPQALRHLLHRDGRVFQQRPGSLFVRCERAGGRPPIRPRARAAARPARVRSRMIERSNSASAPKR